ncbi:GEVED domain-containing protein [Emticicia sp. C21]|uniref:GEVED domain-containing protein n=1 Tax=Emticicia sp. C21 TaxID=2302915 RepID=UPI000E35351E|nr:GEVED domain-containing protein [Emticicia sp. C21]RFS16084.1 hypothetical protein D0T08_14440 [Emticicia sp. C21]
MRNFLLITLSILFYTIFNPLLAQLQCGTDEIYRNNPALKKQVEEQIKHIQNSTNIVDPNTVYTIPLVFIIYHKGEPVGSGSNISDATILNELSKLNDTFRARNQFAGLNDTKVQFALANCGSFNSIVRVDARSVPDYESNGLTYGSFTMETQLRALHNWNDRDNYITVELVHKLNGASGYAGYLAGYTFIDVNIFWYGLMAHEIGHVLNLMHTFEGDNGGIQCPANNNPDTDGDNISDTQPHKSGDNCYAYTSSTINPCSGIEFGDTFENYMCYSGPCWKKFTPKQIERIRNSVSTYMPNWFNSPYLSGQSTPPIGISNLKCGSGAITLLASGCSGTYTWYSDNTIEVPIATGSSYTTPVLNTTTTYYVTCQLLTCTVSVRVPVQAIVTPQNECYCESYASETTDEDIFNVTFGTINNNSDCNSFGGPGSSLNSYSNFTNLAPAIVVKGIQYPFSVKINTCEGNYRSAIKIFIDFNNDKDFTDAGEEVYVSPSSTRGAYTVNGNITIPTTALAGTTRMRVVNEETDIPSAISSCGSYGYGETEDYAITITSSCPDDLIYESITQGSGIYRAVNTINSRANISSLTTYIAGKFITLLPGFSAGPDEVFKSEIGGCN